MFGQRLDLRAGVDVHHDHRARMLRLPAGELLGGDRVRQRIAGLQIQLVERSACAEAGRVVSFQAPTSSPVQRGLALRTWRSLARAPVRITERW